MSCSNVRNCGSGHIDEIPSEGEKLLEYATSQRPPHERVVIAAHARALGRLIHELEGGATNDVIGAHLAAVVRHLRPRAVELRVGEQGLEFPEISTEDAANPELATLHAALTRHGITGVSVRMGVTPKELLQFAALLAVRSTENSQPSVFEAVRQLGFWHITLRGESWETAKASLPVLPPAFPVSTAEAATTQIAQLQEELAKALTAADAIAVAHVLTRAVRSEQAAQSSGTATDANHAGIASQWSTTIATMLSVAALRLISGLIATHGYPREALVTIVRRAGDQGASAVLQQLSTATSLVDRRTLFDAIVQAGVGERVLTAMLEHPQWFVVRNAAALLGAMRATTAEAALISNLSHADERVRTSVATALVQLGTQSGRKALEIAIRDASTEVRRRALKGLLSADGLARSAAVLSEALDLERDPDVQLEVVNGLRAIGTPQAVQQLLKLCSPSGSAGKSTAFRRAALDALVSLRPTAAVPLLRIQAQDRDEDTRRHAQALLEQMGRAA